MKTVLRSILLITRDDDSHHDKLVKYLQEKGCRVEFANERDFVSKLKIGGDAGGDQFSLAIVQLAVAEGGKLDDPDLLGAIKEASPETAIAAMLPEAQMPATGEAVDLGLKQAYIVDRCGRLSDSLAGAESTRSPLAA